MEEKTISVSFFRNQNGEEPVKSWLKSLNPIERKKIGKDMILLHGFIKKTQKTPKKDLDLARSRKNELGGNKDNHE